MESTNSWDNLRRRRQDEGGVGERGINVGDTERLLSGVAAVALAILVLRRRRLRRLLLPLASGLALRALTGRSKVNQALGRNTAQKGRLGLFARGKRGQGIRVEEATTINRPRAEVFAFWRNFENLPRFMDHLEAVQVIDENRSRWVGKAPAGARVEWDAEIHNEIPNELIAWRSLPGSEVDHTGSVHFRPAGDATEVRVILRYGPPGGRLGAAVARLLGEEPSRQVAEDLRRFKQVLEAGEVSMPSRG